MNNKTRVVFRGWVSLSSEEKRDFSSEMQSYDRRTLEGQREVRKSLTEVNLGPVQQGCPCCGR